MGEGAQLGRGVRDPVSYRISTSAPMRRLPSPTPTPAHTHTPTHAHTHYTAWPKGRSAPTKSTASGSNSSSTWSPPPGLDADQNDDHRAEVEQLVSDTSPLLWRDNAAAACIRLLHDRHGARRTPGGSRRASQERSAAALLRAQRRPYPALLCGRGDGRNPAGAGGAGEIPGVIATLNHGEISRASRRGIDCSAEYPWLVAADQ
jgi:hypothetical protein